MKRLVVEDENEGLLALLNEKVMIMTSGYFYHGILEGVNETCIKLKNPGVIYETGAWSDSSFKDLQLMGVNSWYISMGAIESFGIMDKQ